MEDWDSVSTLETPAPKQEDWDSVSTLETPPSSHSTRQVDESLGTPDQSFGVDRQVSFGVMQPRNVDPQWNPTGATTNVGGPQQIAQIPQGVIDRTQRELAHIDAGPENTDQLLQGRAAVQQAQQANQVAQSPYAYQGPAANLAVRSAGQVGMNVVGAVDNMFYGALKEIGDATTAVGGQHLSDFAEGQREQINKTIQNAAAKSLATSAQSSFPMADQAVQQGVGMIGEVSAAVAAGGAAGIPGETSMYSYMGANGFSRSMAASNAKGITGYQAVIPAVTTGMIDAMSGKAMTSFNVGLGRIANDIGAEDSPLVSKVINGLADKYDISPSMQKLATLGVDGSGQVAIGAATDTAHYMDEVAQGLHPFDKKELRDRILAGIPAQLVAGLGGGAYHLAVDEVVNKLSDRQDAFQNLIDKSKAGKDITRGDLRKLGYNIGDSSVDQRNGLVQQIISEMQQRPEEVGREPQQPQQAPSGQLQERWPSSQEVYNQLSDGQKDQISGMQRRNPGAYKNLMDTANRAATADYSPGIPLDQHVANHLGNLLDMQSDAPSQFPEPTPQEPVPAPEKPKSFYDQYHDAAQDQDEDSPGFLKQFSGRRPIAEDTEPWAPDEPQQTTKASPESLAEDRITRRGEQGQKATVAEATGHTAPELAGGPPDEPSGNLSEGLAKPTERATEPPAAPADDYGFGALGKMGDAVSGSYYDALHKSLSDTGEVMSPERGSSVDKAWQIAKKLGVEPEDFVSKLKGNYPDNAVDWQKLVNGLPDLVKSSAGKMADFSKEFIKYAEAHPELAATKLEDIRRAFKVQKLEPHIGTTKDLETGETYRHFSIKVTLPNGRKIFIDPFRQELSLENRPLTVTKVAKDYGISEDVVRSAKVNGVYTSGEDSPSSGGGKIGFIKLVRDADAGHLSHEQFHALMDLSLNDSEKAAILKRYGTEENAAEVWRRKEGFTRGPGEKIQKMLNRLSTMIRGSDPLDAAQQKIAPPPDPFVDKMAASESKFRPGDIAPPPGPRQMPVEASPAGRGVPPEVKPPADRSIPPTQDMFGPPTPRAKPTPQQEAMPTLVEQFGSDVAGKVAQDKFQYLGARVREQVAAKENLYYTLAQKLNRSDLVDRQRAARLYNEGMAPFIDPKDNELVATMNGLLKRSNSLVQKWSGGSSKAIENYISGRWVRDAEGNVGMITGNKSMEGSKNFLHQKTFRTEAEAQEAGMVEVTNFVERNLISLREQYKYIAANEFMDWAKKNGIAKLVLKGTDADAGFSLMTDNVGKVFRPGEQEIKITVDASLWDALRKTVQNLGGTMVESDNFGRKKTGYYTPSKGEVNVKVGDSLAAMHEIGHLADHKLNLYDELGGNDPHLQQQMESMADRRWRSEGNPTTTKEYRDYVQNPQERVANLFHAYMYAPDMFQKAAPELYQRFEQMVDNHPELAPIKDGARDVRIGVESAKVGGGYIHAGTYQLPERFNRYLENLYSPSLIGRLKESGHTTAAAVLTGAQSIKGAMNGANLIGPFHPPQSYAASLVADIQTGILRAQRGIKDLDSVKMRDLLTKDGWSEARKGLTNVGIGVTKAGAIPLGTTINPWVGLAIAGGKMGFNAGAGLLIKRGGEAFAEHGWFNQKIPAWVPKHEQLNRWAQEAGKRVLEAGGKFSDSPMMSAQHSFEKALVDLRDAPDLIGKMGAAERVLWHNTMNAMQSSLKPVMHTVMWAKLYSFNELAQERLASLPADASNYDRTRVLNDTWNHADEIFGQIVWDRVNLSRTNKDVAQILLRSPGWVGGSLLYASRGLAEAADTMTGVRNASAGQLGMSGTDHDMITPRMAGLAAFAIANATANTIYQQIKTGGKVPMQGLDYFMPRDGGKNKDGTDSRVSVMAYPMEWYNWITHPLITFGHKLSPTIGAGYEHGVTGVDYFGNPLPPVATDLVQRFQPFAYRNAVQRAGGESAFSLKNLAGGMESLLGIRPVPLALTRSPAMQSAFDYQQTQGHRQLTQDQQQQQADKRNFVQTTLDKGGPDELQQAVNKKVLDGEMSKKAADAIIRKATGQPLVNQLKFTPLEPAIKSYGLRNQDQDTPELKALMQAKLNNALTSRPYTDAPAILQQAKDAGLDTDAAKAQYVAEQVRKATEPAINPVKGAIKNESPDVKQAKEDARQQSKETGWNALDSLGVNDKSELIKALTSYQIKEDQKHNPALLRNPRYTPPIVGKGGMLTDFGKRLQAIKSRK